MAVYGGREAGSDKYDLDGPQGEKYDLNNPQGEKYDLDNPQGETPLNRIRAKTTIVLTISERVDWKDNLF